MSRLESKLMPLTSYAGTVTWAECHGCSARTAQLWGWGEPAKEVRHCVTTYNTVPSTLMYQWFCERCCKQKGWLW